MSAMEASSSSAVEKQDRSKSAKNSSEPGRDLNILQSVSDLRTLCRTFQTCCYFCYKPVPTGDYVEHIEKWSLGARTIPPTSQLSAFACTSCANTTCVGCNQQPSTKSTNLFTPLGVVNHCCDRGRLHTIFFLLCRFDESQIQPEKKTVREEPIKKPAPAKPAQSKAKIPQSNGIGYASGFQGMSGFHGWQGMIDPDMDDLEFASEFEMGHHHYMYGAMTVPRPPEEANDDKKAKDALFIETVRLLGACLPESTAAAIEENSLFRLSMLIDRITDLIRNDSISDVVERSELYSEVIAFVKAISNIPSLATLLFEERPEKSRSPGIQKLSNMHVSDTKVAQLASATMYASAYDSSKNLYWQIKTYLKLAAKKTLAGGSAQTPVNPLGRDTMRLCEGILDIHETLRTLVDRYTEKPSSEEPSTSKDQQETTWADFQQENKVTFTDDVLNAHRYTKEMANFTTSVAKNRLNTISKEVATLTTSLPEGIFLKIAESRSDVMKLLIIGSEGSPYAGGLFTFDIWLPAEYPLVPPRFSFVLDGNDSDAYSFNPNLHVGGSVCLSILNTWSGMPQEMWQPNKSTLLAVLVSIQAMILGAPFPWHNEPGHEHEGESAQVKENKKVVQMKTIRHAMIAWAENKFENPKLKEYIWKDIAQTYLNFNGDNVLNTASGWVEENPFLLEYSPALPFPMGIKKGRRHQQHNASAQPVNLINKLAVSLGKEAPYPEVEAGEDGKKGLLGKLGLKGKRKNSLPDLELAHHQKKQKSEPDLSGEKYETRWIYTGIVNQKESRAACKEFGIGAASSIKNSIAKLEKHINDKGKADPELMKKWGKMVYVTDPELEVYPSSSDDDSFPESLPGNNVGTVAW